MARSTICGTPLESKQETKASPVPSSVNTCNVSNFGFSLKLSAAALNAFCSFGV